VLLKRIIGPGMTTPPRPVSAQELAGLPAFPCSGCGACCMDVRHVPELAEYVSGTGRCSKLAPDNKTCTIYTDRPLVCRVDDLGRFIRLTPGSWRLLNRQSCGILHQQQHSAPLEAVGETCRHEAVR
jgi:hypothetical protein